MAIPSSLPTLAADDLQGRVDLLAGAGARVLLGTVVDSSGVLRAKQVPISRAAAFHFPGLGASPTWLVFCADDAIAFTPNIGVVGDLRLRADLTAAIDLGDGLAWAPLELADQQGESLPFCWRGTLRRQQAAAETTGLDVRSAVEIELVVFDEGGQRAVGVGGPAYGARPLFELEAFIDDVHGDFERAGLAIEQLHAEYGAGQLELSVAPASPLQAADANVLARLLLGRAARRRGLRLSLSPRPFAAGIGNGAHVHLSFARDRRPLLSGGQGPHGLTEEGGMLLGGLVSGLPEAIGVLAPSLLSPHRLQPNTWAGAFACWGLENREAAVRFCAATPGNPHGAHVEVKCVDPSANPYVVQALLLGLALRGLANRCPLPPETVIDPAQLDQEERDRLGIVPIGRDQAQGLDRLESSTRVRDIVGPQLLEALVAVRRHEVEVARTVPFEELVERFRFSWSI